MDRKETKTTEVEWTDPFEQKQVHKYPKVKKGSGRGEHGPKRKKKDKRRAIKARPRTYQQLHEENKELEKELAILKKENEFYKDTLMKLKNREMCIQELDEE